MFTIRYWWSNWLDLHCSVGVLCFTCAHPWWEREWNFSIEDDVPINKKKNISSSFKTRDLMKDKGKVGKSQKMWKKRGRLMYHSPARCNQALKQATLQLSVILGKPPFILDGSFDCEMNWNCFATFFFIFPLIQVWVIKIWFMSFEAS